MKGGVIMSDYYSPKKHDCFDERKHDCCGKKRKKDDCFECGTVTLTINNNPLYTISYFQAAGNVECIALLAPGSNGNTALHCLFKDGFKIVAFTADTDADDSFTYTLTNC